MDIKLEILFISMMFVILYLNRLKILNKISNKTFNIGGGTKNAISLRDLTLECQKLTGNKLKIKNIKNLIIRYSVLCHR